MYSPSIPTASKLSPPSKRTTQIKEGYPGTSAPVINVLIKITIK